ncbi:MAG: hypothetical protein LBT88_01000 [Oscillospiraceae bacterium]|jgi:hypothetical protein|nr:hypothetical protein [Oscillospiraceae bacterium]
MINKYPINKATAGAANVNINRLEFLDGFCRRMCEERDKHDYIAVRVTRGDKLVFNGQYGSQYDAGGTVGEPLKTTLFTSCAH